MDRMLVTFATRAGSTIGVAQAIADVLKLAGTPVDVYPIQRVDELEQYNAVVIGSAIRMGAWLPEAVAFVAKNKAVLSRVPTAFFTVHMLNRDGTDRSRKAREAYTAPVREILTPMTEVFFDGVMDYTKLNFLERVIAKSVAKSANAPEGDFRDWETIRNWAKEIELTFEHAR